MIPNRACTAAFVLGIFVWNSGSVVACGNPSEKWYRDASDVIFDGVADCKPEQKSCRVRVTRIFKNPLHLDMERRSIDIDYYSWYDEYYENNPDMIVLACGVPHFKPEESRFRARFYANFDRESGELVVRRYLIDDEKAN